MAWTGRQGIQGIPHSLGHAFEMVQRADDSKHMGGVRRAAVLSVQQLLGTAQRQKGVEPLLFRTSGGAAANSLRTEARIRQVQSQPILAVNGTADSIGRTPV
jgi:hypothetical protein